MAKMGKMGTQQTPWVVMTGASRGLGRALAQALGREVSVLGLARTAGSTPCAEECLVDLARTDFDELDSCVKTSMTGKAIVGFVHCAGVLGPVGQAGDSQEDRGAHLAAWREAMRVNVESCVALVEGLIPHMTARSEAAPPFVAHLSSGAARNAYVGWEAYCAGKAAALSYFRCLGKRFEAGELAALSIAPGTVMTDMMRRVLASDPQDFPDVKKFRELQARGELADPVKVAETIAALLLGGHAAQAPLHGKFFDVRKGVPE